MKSIFTFLTLTSLTTSLVLAGKYYSGPTDERMPPGFSSFRETIGWFAQAMNVSGVADVIAVEPATAKYPHGSFTIHVVNSIYGCTNGQILVVAKEDSSYGINSSYDPNWEYYPTNNSRIVFVGVTTNETRIGWGAFNAKEWKLPPESEVIHPSTNTPVFLLEFTRAWWYDGYQNNLPYIHLTNLVHAARIERNWTNYYHIIRDAVPTPAAPRVWEDSFEDILDLIFHSTRKQYDFMANDPLFPADCREYLDSFLLGLRSIRPFPSDD